MHSSAEKKPSVDKRRPAGPKTPREILIGVVAHVAESVPADHICFGELHENTPDVDVIYAWDRDGTTTEAAGSAVHCFDDELLANLRSGIDFVVDDVTAAPHLEKFRTTLDEIGAASIVQMPAPPYGGQSFFMEVSRRAPYRWRRDQLDLLREITDRVAIRLTRARAEAQIAESEERYRTLFESIDEGFVIVEMIFDSDDRPVDYRFIEANPSFTLLTGLPPDALGKTARELVPDLEDFWFETYGKVALTGESVRFEHCAEPMGRWFDVHASRVTGSGNRVAIVFNNSTERKLTEAKIRESEARFRNMADSAPVMIWVTEPDGSRSYLSKSWYEFTGQTEESGLGFGWLQAIHLDDAEESGRIFLEANEKHEPFRIEYRLLSVDGEYRWAIDSAKPRFSGSGEFLGYIGSVIDITDRKQNEALLQKANEELEVRVEARTQELADTNRILSVEVEERRALAQIRAELLQRLVTLQEDERKRIARDLHDQLGQQLTALRLKLMALRTDPELGPEQAARAERLQEIATQIDSSVTFIAGQLRPSALDDLGLQEALKMYALEWSQRFDVPLDYHSNVFLKQRLTPEVETHLYRIAQEALNNVVKHANATEVAVVLEKSETGVTLVIEDNGDGFDPKTKQTLDPGHGFGLIGMTERSNLIGAHLEIESRAGRGTTIYVRVEI